MQFRDRFINNRIVECLSRPQYPYSCGLTALTCVVNYLWSQKLGIVTQESLADQLGFCAKTSGEESPGNQTILNWFETFRHANTLRGTGEIFLDRHSFPKSGTAAFEQTVAELKKVIRSETAIMIYHADNHYNIPCGYFESAESPDEAYVENPYVNRWLVLAEHLDSEDPIRCVRMKDVRKTLRDRDYGILLFRAG